MTRFYFRVWGRRIGALGLVQFFKVCVDADNREAAELRLYEKLEHVTATESAPDTAAPTIEEL